MSGPYDQNQQQAFLGGQQQAFLGGQQGGVLGGQQGTLLGGQQPIILGGPQGLPLGGQQTTTVQHHHQQQSYSTAGQVPLGQQTTAAVSSSNQQQSSSRGDRRRLQRSGSSTSTSSSSSVREYKYGSQTGVTSGQQYSAEGGYALGASQGSLGSGVSGQRRQGRYRREVIRLPDQTQGQVRQVRKRMPTPEPDTLERVYIQRTAGEVVEEITEIPMTPPPRVQERTVVEPAGPSQVIKKVIRVPPRGNYYGGQQQQQGASFSAGGAQGNLLSAGSFGSVQQGASGYQQQFATSQPPANFGGSAGFGSYGPSAGGFPQQGFGGGFQQSQGFGGGFQQPQSFGGGYQQQQQQQQQGFGGGYQAQRVQPPPGVHPAFCFYV